MTSRVVRFGSHLRYLLVEASPGWLPENNRLHRIARHIGRRGGFLAAFGIVYVLVGFNLTQRIPQSQADAYKLATALAPIWVYGLLWIACGATALLVAVWHQVGRYGAGFAALTLSASLWSVVWAAAWIHGDATRGYQGAVIYGAFAFTAQIVAGLVDPVPVEKVAP